MNTNNLCDYHIHTRYSSDSSEEPANVVSAARRLGLSEICFTDHIDLDFPKTEDFESGAFFFDINDYFNELTQLRDAICKDSYIIPNSGISTSSETSSLKIKIGVELGLMPYLAKRNAAFAGSADFDFVIGSTHLIDKKDPYYPSFWEGRPADDVVAHYFSETYDNIRAGICFDVYGHLDYITRYAPDKSYVFSYKKHSDIIDAILKELISAGCGIEVNTSPFAKGHTQPNPCRDIIMRYRELGGEIITLGSDAHSSQNIAVGFDIARDMLADCGFSYYTVFEKRKAGFIKL